MEFDRVLDHIGHTGRWNLLNYAFLSLTSVMGGLVVITHSFAGLEPKYRCKILGCDKENEPAFDDIPLDLAFDKEDFCRAFPSRNGSCTDFNRDEALLRPCIDGFIFKDFDMNSTVVTEFNLLCQDQYKVALAGTVYMAGLLASSGPLGLLADRLGRKVVLAASILLTASGSLGGSFVPNYELYCVTRFITAFGGMGTFMIGFILLVELAPTNHKTLAGVLFQSPFALGEAMVPLVAFLLPQWRDFQLAVSVPLILAISVCLVVPESPRWLLKVGRYREYQKVVEKAAKMNKVDLPLEVTVLSKPEEVATALDEVDYVTQDGDGKRLGIGVLFSNRTIAQITLTMWLNWNVVTIGYYGMSMSGVNLGRNIFTNTLLVSLVEIPAHVFVALSVDHLGRKTMFVVSLFLNGFGCISAAFVPEGAVKVLVALIGKFGVASAFTVVYLYTAELHPTEIRSTATGICSLMARIGGMAAPQVAIFLPSLTFREFPFIVMGSMAFIGALLSLLLPETLGSPLVESLSEIDLMQENSKPFFSWWSSKTLAEHLARRQRQKKNRAPSC